MILCRGALLWKLRVTACVCALESSHSGKGAGLSAGREGWNAQSTARCSERLAGLVALVYDLTLTHHSSMGERRGVRHFTCSFSSAGKPSHQPDGNTWWEAGFVERGALMIFKRTLLKPPSAPLPKTGLLKTLLDWQNTLELQTVLGSWSAMRD